MLLKLTFGNTQLLFGDKHICFEYKPRLLTFGTTQLLFEDKYLHFGDTPIAQAGYVINAKRKKGVRKAIANQNGYGSSK